MADHYTFFRMRAQPGKQQAVLDMFDKWEREQKSKATGYIRTILVTNNEDPDELMAGVRFDSTENYNANSGRAEQGEWYQAQLHYQQALKKLLESKKLQAAQDELQLKIDARVAALEIELLMARGEWLKQRLTVQTKLSPLLPRKSFAAWRHEAVKKEGKKVAAELGLVGKRAVQQGEFSLAAQSFDLALELHPDPVIEEARKALSNKKRRAIVKNKKDALKALSISLQEALNERRLGEASVIAIQLEKQGSPNEEEQRLIQQLNRDIRKQVIEELELGAGHYGRGQYTQAISAWSNVLALEPDNTEAAIRIRRAKRVVQKLRQLSEDKVE